MQKIDLFEIHSFEINRVMAALAIAPKAAVVLIIRGMTTEAIVRQFHFVGRFAMTIGTLCFSMLAR